MISITCIGRDNGNKGYETVLIYDLEVPNLKHETALKAFIEARRDDIDLDKDDIENIEVLFAFPRILTIADWRE